MIYDFVSPQRIRKLRFRNYFPSFNRIGLKGFIVMTRKKWKKRERERERSSSRLSTAIVPPCSSIRHSVSCPPPYFTNQLWQPSPQTFRDFVHSFGSLPLNHPRLLSSQLSNLLSKLPLWSSISFYPSSTPKKFPGKFFLLSSSSFFPFLFSFFFFFHKTEEHGTEHAVKQHVRWLYFIKNWKRKKQAVSFSRFLFSRKRQPTTMLYIYIYIYFPVLYIYIKWEKIICLKDTKEGNVNSVRNVKASRNLQNVKRSKKRKKKKKKMRANTVRICRGKL